MDCFPTQSGRTHKQTPAQQDAICATFIERFVHFPFFIVQSPYGRTSRHPMVVRPYLLTPYVQTPFERTSTRPTPYVQGISTRGNGRFAPSCLYFFALSELSICLCSQPSPVLSHSQSVCVCQNESKYVYIAAKISVDVMCTKVVYVY